MYTEKEAGDMKCPLSMKLVVPFSCISSQCMAWRWAGYEQAKLVNEQFIVTGYCGLAGKPE